MPKRSAKEKLTRYQRKIRRIQEDEIEKRRLLRYPMDPSDDEYFADPVNAETCLGKTDEPAVVPENEPDEMSPLLSPPTSVPPQQPPLITELAGEPEKTQVTTTPSTEILPDTEPPLDPELLSALGACSSDTPDFGECIHDSLAALWLPLLRKGLPKDEKDKLLKEYLIPVNCKLLQAPKLNAEMAAAVSEIVRGRDKKLANFQQTPGSSTSAINRAMDTLPKSDNKVQALKFLSDGCRLLSDLHHSFTTDRTKLIIPSLEKKVLQVIQDTERDDTLFGNSLVEKIKACKAIEKQGQQIRKISNQKIPITVPQPSRPAYQGNWSAPPRYLSQRGGREGHQKQVPRGTRRPIHMTATQTASKNFSHPKTRASTQH